jgi:predicted MPP superfamily phosphohydrolase
VLLANPTIVILVYNILLFAFASGVFLLWWKRSPRASAASFVLSFAALVLVSVVGALSTPIARFGRVQLLAWAVFLHYPLFLLAGAARFFRQRRRFAHGCVVVAVVIILACVDAFLIEPHWLEVSHVELSSAKVASPLRIAVIADLQTDAPGRYERRVLARVQEEAPDLILFVGDYLDVGDPERYEMMSRRLNGMLHEADMNAPLGVYAVPGNVDWTGRWQGIFAGLPVRTFERSATVDVGPVALTGLTLRDAANTDLSIEGTDGFHVVVGHSPNFSLGQIDAGLLVAGHTHGGQVQLPLMGPIVTLSQVPRAWASGVTEIEPGKTLVVSRGIGMERGNAPRMRFLCRPQLVILEVVPAESGLQR